MDKYTKEDFSTSNEVRWCPGCGDYAILMALQRMLPSLGLPPHQHVFVSGIGCSGRFPYYLNTYGFHTIHGRPLPVATGLKIMRPELAVWVVTGDGDALSIGGNHLLHCLRRNVDLTILLINNEVYGLTKGQFSPTSKKGQITKTSPSGVVNEPCNPLMLALAAGAGFVARAIDKDVNQLMKILQQAYEHKGTSFVEIYQECNIFNLGAFDSFAVKNNRADNTIVLERDKPLMLVNGKYGLVLEKDNLRLREGSSGEQQFCYHDPSNYLAAIRLAQLNFPKFPVPLGIYYQKERPVFGPENLNVTRNIADLSKLFRDRASWQIC